MRGYRDRDFIADRDGLIFCVVGNVHPPRRVICYLKYVPEYREGYRSKWSRNGQYYGRILPYYSAVGVAKTYSYLESHKPEYLVWDEYLNVKFPMVPVDSISIHYKPEERLSQILRECKDSLEQEVKELYNIIRKESGVEALGISGSILLGIHNPKISDIDLTVYGIENSLRVKQALTEIIREQTHGIRKPADLVERWARNIVQIQRIPYKAALNLYMEKWNRALYHNRQFSVHPVKTEGEVTEKYGSHKYLPIGFARISCTITDARESLFLPGTYRIADVNVIDGPSEAGKIEAIVTYEGLYSDVATEGDRVVAYGKLEKVVNIENGEVSYRLLIGSQEAESKDYILKEQWL